MTKPIILFILKRREDFDPKRHTTRSLSTGLYNSVLLAIEMLINHGVDARIEVAVDNNCIDRLVAKHQPTHVMIEALWVIPSKFPVLCKLHPNVTWLVRLHSELPFISNEGVAMDWISDYSTNQKMVIAANAPRMERDLREYLQIKNKWSDYIASQRVVYLPNYFPSLYSQKEYVVDQKDAVDISCFGAVRPLKNHLVQAIAALRFANYIGKKLHFHINTGRIEMKGEPIISNLRDLFEQLYDQGHKLVINEWAPREDFLRTCAKIDLALQVSFNETFNIVAADHVSVGVPVVGSANIPWLSSEYTADCSSSDDILSKLLLTHANPRNNVLSNQQSLAKYTDETIRIWLRYFT